MKKFEHKTKDERRRVLLSKNNELSYTFDNEKLPEGARVETDVLAKSQDLAKRFLAAFLALVFALTAMVLGVNLVVRADNDAVLKPAKVVDDDSSMVLNKYLTPANDGTYDLTLEAYTTADMKTITEKVPTDFVVVVDQSGSMADSDMPTGTPTLQNNKYIEDIASGAYYYKDGDNFYRVYGVKDYLYRYYPANFFYVGDIVERLGQRLGWFMGNTEATANFSNQLYFRETVGNNVYYQPITMTVKGVVGAYDVRFKYDSKQTGGVVWFNREDPTYMNGHQAPWYKNVLGGGLIDDDWGITLVGGQRVGYPQVNSIVQGIYREDEQYCHSTFTIIPRVWKLETGMYVNYPVYDRHVGYTKLCYRDIDGVVHEVPSNQNNGQTTWEFCDDGDLARSAQSATSARPTYSGLYTFPTTTTRLEALKAALNEFAQAVADETDTFGAVDNRISIVGFSSPGFYNTELLTHTERDINNNSTNGWQKGTCDGNVSEYYGKGLVPATNGSVGAVNGKISNAINALTANGGTQPEDGLNMAYQVLTNRGGSTTYTIRSGENKGDVVDRNTVVIFFTDGRPGDYHYSNQYTEANEVIEQAKAIKEYKDTSLFSIGVFGESDGNPLTYDGRNDWTQDNQGNNVRVSSLDKAYWEYLGGWMETHTSSGISYCLRRQWRQGSEGYTEEPNDTIFDYMSVTSSNYPDAEEFIAPAWLDGSFSGNYINATDGVRHKETAESTNKYYRMASNQDTLVKAFLQAVSTDSQETTKEIKMDANAVLTDVIDTSSFVLPTHPTATVQTAKYTLNSDTDTIEDDRWDAPVDSGLNPVWNGNQVTVTGFDYSTNYIAWDKPASGELEANTGRKIIVTIPGLKPIQNITTIATKILYSNTNDASVTSGDGKTVVHFAMPYISRHSYTLDVQGENKANAVFSVTASLTGGTSSLDDVILVKPDGTRVKYSSALEFDMRDTQSFYFENVPSDYTITTSVKAKDDDYTYTMWANGDTNEKSQLNTETGTPRTLSFSDNTLHINSVANTRQVTITETVSGNYANDLDTFQPVVYLVPSSGDVPADGMTLNGTVWTKVPNENKLTTSIAAIQGDGSSTTITVPAGWTLYVEQTDDKEYTVESISYTTGGSGSQNYNSTTGIPLTANVAITINNDRSNITIEGIGDESDSANVVLYALASLAVASGGAGVAYLYRKKDEFVE